MKLLFADYFPWGHGPKVGNHHYARLFRKDGHDVCWLSQFLNYNRLIRRSEEDEIFINSWKAGLRQCEDGVWSLTPLALLPYIDAPLLRSPWLGRRTLKWTVPSVRGALAKIGADEPDVLWLGIPRMASLARAVRSAKQVVYRMSDLVTGFKGNPASVEELEIEICRKSSVVFATAQDLVVRAERWAKNVVYLPNGVDLERFDLSVEEPECLAEIPHPRLLYVGAISGWYDMDVLDEITDKRPDAHLVLVGPIAGTSDVQNVLKARMKTLSAKPNVHYLGFQSPTLVPGLMRHCDVGLIPFQCDEFTHSISPIKLFEYAAAGLPVVSRNLDETRRQGGPTFYYDTPSECIAAVDEAVSRRDELFPQMRTFAEANTWDTRYETARDALNSVTSQ